MRFNLGDRVRYQPHYQPHWPDATWDPDPWEVFEIQLTWHRGKPPRLQYAVAQYLPDGTLKRADFCVRDDQLALVHEVSLAGRKRCGCHQGFRGKVGSSRECSQESTPSLSPGQGSFSPDGPVSGS